jgi:hypothetical protein
MFINLKTDPCILYSSPCGTCVNLPPPIAFRLLLTSALGCYSELRSSSVIHPPLSTSLQSCTHIYRPHSELHVYLCYKFSDVHSGVRSDIRVSIHLTSPSPCLWTLFGPPSSSTLRSEPLPSNSAWTSMSHSVLQI